MAASNPETKETLSYRRALLAGMELIRGRPLSANSAVEVCSIIHGRHMDVRKLAGTFIGNPATHDATFTRRAGESVIREKLSNWESFIYETRGLDPLVIMAIAHYQFEAIHPFEDGNGRTGRIMNVFF